MFIYPDSELNVQLIRILTILDKSSFNRNGKGILTIEKIVAFDFLIQHPFILFNVLQKTGKKHNLFLKDYESNSINREYPNLDNLFYFENTKKLLQILIFYDYCNIEIVEDNEVIYFLTNHGKSFMYDFESPYSKRLGELAQELKTFYSESYKNLVSNIKPYAQRR